MPLLIPQPKRPIYDVTYFGARGDGSDDTLAIQEALGEIRGSGRSGILYFPAPSSAYRYTESIVLGAQGDLTSDNYIVICGDGPDRTLLDYDGPDEAIKILAPLRVQVMDLRLDPTDVAGNLTTNAIKVGYVGARTGWMYRFQHLHIVGFTAGAGIYYTNCEQTVTEQCNVFGCGTGFKADNSTHDDQPDSGKGMANVWIANRAQDSLGDGWDINHQHNASFIGNEGINNVTTVNGAQAWIRGGCNNCYHEAWDVERTPADNTTVGLRLSGPNHTVVNTNCFGLLQGIVGSSLTFSKFGRQKFTSCTSSLVLDASSTDNEFDNFGYAVSSSGKRGTYNAKGVTAVSTTPYNVLRTDHNIVVDASGGARSVVLLAADVPAIGVPLVIKKIDASGNAVTITGTVDGAVNPTLAAQYDYMVVVTDGTSYHKIGTGP